VLACALPLCRSAAKCVVSVLQAVRQLHYMVVRIADCVACALAQRGERRQHARQAALHRGPQVPQRLVQRVPVVIVLHARARIACMLLRGGI
jgi:hypothetical protein